MLVILMSLIPVFLVIALGFLLKRYDFPGGTFWVPLDQLNYFVFFPALLLDTLATADFSHFNIWPMAAAMAGGQLSMVVVLVIGRRFFPIEGPEFSSVFQGAVRWNSFVALAAISSMFGPHGLTLAAIGIAIMVPISNTMSVIALTRYAQGISANPLVLGKLLVKNPMLLACAAGIALNATGVGLAEPLAVTAKLLGSAALTLGLLSVGAGLRIGHVIEEKWAVLYTSTLKLIVMPVLMMSFCILFNVEGLPRLVVLICAAVPGATSSYVLARQLGGHTELMASLITGGTVLAAITMPLILWVFG